MGKTKEHQHVVPRTYLRGWADCGGRVAVLDRGTDAPRCLAVSNVAVRNRFYNFADEDGCETDAVENWLAEHIESPVAAVLGALRKGVDINDVDQATIRNFTVTQLVRTPTVFALMDHIDVHLGAMLLLMKAAKSGGVSLLDASDADRVRYLGFAREAWAGRQHGRDTRASKLRTMVRKVDEFSSQVAGWHMSVLSSPEPVLMTGDSPVVTVGPPGRSWAGLLPPGSPLWMPLSPTKVLSIDPVKPLGPPVVLSSELAAFINRTLARQADRALINAPGAGWPSWLVFPARKPDWREPEVTWSGSTGPSTFPATYPPVVSPAMEELLVELGAVSSVE